MAEPTLSTPAWGPWVVGLLAAFFAAIGVSWSAVFWAGLGAFFGAGWAPKTGRWRAIAGFPISVLLAAKAGIVWAAWHGPVAGLSPEHAAEAAAAVAGLVFHPAVATAVKALPMLARVRFGVPPSEDAQ